MGRVGRALFARAGLAPAGHHQVLGALRFFATVAAATVLRAPPRRLAAWRLRWPAAAPRRRRRLCGARPRRPPPPARLSLRDGARGAVVASPRTPTPPVGPRHRRRRRGAQAPCGAPRRRGRLLASGGHAQSAGWRRRRWRRWRFRAAAWFAGAPGPRRPPGQWWRQRQWRQARQQRRGARSLART